MEVATSHKTSHSPSSKPSTNVETQRVSALEDSVRDLTEAHRIARLGTWSWVRATGGVVNSPELYAIYGIDPGAVVDLFEDGEKLYAPESWERLRAAATHTFETGDPFELDMEILHPGAESVWVIVSGEVAGRTPDGEISVLHGTVQEITTRKHGDQQLARSEARYRSLLRVTTNLIWSTGDDTGLQNEDLPEWQAFTGQSAADLKGFGWAKAIHPDDREMTLALWNFAVKTETTFRVQQRLRRFDGVYRIMQVRAVPSRNDAGKIVEWVGMHTDITDQVAAAADAGRAHEKLEAALVGMTDGLAMRDPQGRYTFMSERAAQILGVDRKAVIGKLYWEVFPSARHTIIEENTRIALKTRQPMHFEKYMAENVNKWLEHHYYPTEEGLSVYVRDITERKQGEEAVARSEATALQAKIKLEGVLAGMTDGLLTLDKDWRYTYFSEQGASLLGVRAQDMVGNRVWDLYPQAEKSLFGTMYRRAVATRKPVHFEEYYPEPLNIWLECHCYPTDEGLSVYFRDISERKHAEEAIARSQDEAAIIHKTLEGVLASMTDGLNIVDRNWRYTYVNEQSGVLLGVSPKAMLGNILWEMFPLSEAASFGQKMREAVASREPTKTLDYYPEPVNKWLECHFYPTMEGLSIYFTDVTAKLLADESLQRTEKLATAGLLAASIAAEIKAPLDSAASLLHFSLQMELSEKVRANLLLAEHKLARVAQATTQTLRFHRHSTTIPARADVSELMDSALALFDPRFLAAGIHVERDYVSHPRLFCYGDEVRQVFANLLSNALEATPREGTIRLRVRPSPIFGGVRVTIADDGHGIPAAMLPRIFELFVTSKDDATAGLGLWVSDGIMRKHKGRIAVRSSTGTATQSPGTVFSIFLPYSGVESPSALTLRKQAAESSEA